LAALRGDHTTADTASKLVLFLCSLMGVAHKEVAMPRLKISAEMVGFIFTTLLVLASISASYGVSQHRLNKHEAELQEIHDDVDGINKEVDENENILLQLKRDISWIREKLGG
tara:strand:+ start:149 stop:487 length:339 start_codon:yes stop_codon:yes gene_type:complete